MKRPPQSLGWSARIDDYPGDVGHRKNLDIVNIPTRTDLHAPLTIGVLEHRAPRAVIVEKPMATSLTDADRMKELAEANGTRLAIHHQMRTTPTFNVADQLINAGEIGPLTTIKIRGKGYYGGYDMLNIGTHMLNDTRRYAGHARSVVATCVTGGRPTTAADIVEGSYGFGLLAGENISALYEFDERPDGLCGNAPAQRAGQRLDAYQDLRRGRGGVPAQLAGAVHPARARRGGGRHAVGEVHSWPTRTGTCTGTITTTTQGGDLWMAEETVRVLDEDREHECSGLEGRAVMEMMDGAWVSHFSRSRVDFPLERGSTRCARSWQRRGCRSLTRSGGSCGMRIGCRGSWRGLRRRGSRSPGTWWLRRLSRRVSNDVGRRACGG